MNAPSKVVVNRLTRAACIVSTAVVLAAFVLLVPVESGRAAPGDLTPVSPARLLETRDGNFETVDGAEEGGGPIRGGSIRSFRVRGRGGVSSGATAAMLNVAVVAAPAAGHVKVFACAGGPPAGASVNYAAGDIVSNAVLAQIGADGRVCVVSTATTHLVVDVSGFVPSGGAPKPLAPARLMETRTGPGARTVDGRFLSAGPTTRNVRTVLQVTGRGGVAEGASAVMLNIAVVAPPDAGFVKAYPCNSSKPNAASVNYGAGEVVSNAVLARLSPAGTVCLLTSSSTHLVVDVSGFVPTGATPQSLTPARLLETRTGSKLTSIDGRFQRVGPVPGRLIRSVQVANRGGVTWGATAAMLNVAVVFPPRAGWVKIFSCDDGEPSGASLNFRAGEIVSNAVLAQVDSGGNVCVLTTVDVDVVIDVSGFVPGDGVAPPTPQPGSASPSTVAPPVTTVPPRRSPTSGSFSFLATHSGGRPFRWDPCRPIRYAVDVEDAPSSDIAAFNAAVASAEQATAIDFEFVGSTHTDVSDDEADIPVGADVVFVFSDGSESPRLATDVIGFASTIRQFPPGRFIESQVVVDMESGAVGATFLHEIGHVLGLDHVADGREIMTAFESGATQYGQGDREGLWRVGAAQGCFPSFRQVTEGERVLSVSTRR